MSKIVFLVKPVEDFVELHATSLPVGAIFTPKKQAVNPFFLFGENEAPQPYGRVSSPSASSGAESHRSETTSLTHGLTPGVFAKGDKTKIINVYFTLPPEERNGRILWQYLNLILGDLPQDVRNAGFRVGSRQFTKSDEGKLRTAKWSLGNIGGAFSVLGLTNDVNLLLGYGAVLQMRDETKDGLLANIVSVEGFEIRKVETADAFDKVLLDSGEKSVFGQIADLKKTYQKIGPEGVIKKLSEHISLEVALLRLEDDVAGRDPGLIPPDEQRHLLEAFLSRGGSERKKG